MPRRPWLVSLLLILSAPVGAWAPMTHDVVNQLALATLRQRPGFEFLQEERYGSIYIRSGSSADLTFSLSGGGKSHPEVNAVLHEAAFHAHLYQRCVAAGDDACRAFALGLRGHLAGDEVGNTDEAPTAHDSFGWPQDRDVFGDPVSEPGASAAAQLRNVTIGLNKIMIDGLVRGEREAGRDYDPYIDEDALYQALISYDGPHAVPHGSEEVRRQLAEDLHSMARSFRRSFGLLQLVSRRFWDDRRLRGPVSEELGGLGRALPKVPESVLRAVLTAEGMVAGTPVPAPTGHCCQVWMQAATLEVLGRSLSEAAGVAAVAETDPLPASSYPDLEAADAAALAVLEKKVMKTFAANAMVPLRRWEVVRRRVRGLVPLDPRSFRDKVAGRVEGALRRIPGVEDLIQR